MNKNLTLIGLSAVIVFQGAVLAGEYLNAVYPLWTGTEVKINTVPVDPRSLFRGNYARLNYTISSIPSSDLGVSELAHNLPRDHERVYVKLKQGEDGVYVYDGASLSAPTSGVFMRGRIQTQRWDSNPTHYRVLYGIEAYFAPKDKALALERDLRGGGGIATVMVAANGKATLKTVASQ